MKKVQKKRRVIKEAGLPPGSVVFTGSKKVDKVFISYLDYDATNLTEKHLDNHEDIVFLQSPEETVDWYDVRGLHDTALLESLGKTFEIHPLVLEDIADTYQRPKFEEYEKGIFIIIRALAFDKENLQIKTEQIALYFRKGLLLSFQETKSDIFEAVRKRLHSGRGKIRARGADYLAYALLDNIVDNYYNVLDEMEDVIEVIEEKIIDNPDMASKEKIHHLKKELLVVRKSIAPLREAIGRFSKSESPFVDDSSSIFIRDLYDHTIQTMDMVETYRDMLNGLHDLHVSEISYRMNQVMQVLTVITTIFVPLTFLAGIYGMNFDNIPELHYKYGYFVLLSVMFMVFTGLLLYFRAKKWF